jgi:PIN domain nuclease of toxin-antitoxin system
MKLLLDTATVLWLAADDARLSSRARDAYENKGNVPVISVISIWEILVKHQLGKLPLSRPIEEILRTMRADGVMTLSLNESAVRKIAGLPDIHRDPFDRMLICQAIDEGMTIVTPDRLMTSYPVMTLW